MTSILLNVNKPICIICGRDEQKLITFFVNPNIKLKIKLNKITIDKNNKEYFINSIRFEKKNNWLVYKWIDFDNFLKYLNTFYFNNIFSIIS